MGFIYEEEEEGGGDFHRMTAEATDVSSWQKKRPGNSKYNRRSYVS